MREFLERFPDPGDEASHSDGSVRVVRPAAPRSPSHTALDTARKTPDTGLRLTLADPGLPFSGGRILADLRPRWKAAAWDLGFISAVGGALFVLLGMFWMPLGIVTVVYYAGGILLLGNSPGVCLFAPVPKDRVEEQGQEQEQLQPEPAGLGLTLSLTSRDS
jgi:hypothetical protein